MRRPLTLLLVALLLAGCTGSQPDLDQDDDLVDDSIETEGKLIIITTLTGEERRHVTSDPTKRDTDSDGLVDSDELLVRGTDPRDPDTDDDGLLDGDDRIAPDDATASAWRNAGILEVEGTFLGELDACEAGGPQLRANVASSDLPVPDELLDGEELRGWDANVRGQVRRVTSDPCSPDTDGDGFPDHREKLAATDPRDPDTDGDGVRDPFDGDPSWDLGLAFSDLDARPSGNTTRVRLLFATGSAQADLAWPGNGSATIEVGDQAANDDLQASVIITAEDLVTGEPLALFDDPRGVIVVFHLLDGTVEGALTDGEKLAFSGDDGSFTLAWRVARR